MTPSRDRLRPRAIHEAGHAIAAIAFGHQFDLARVSAMSGRVEGGRLQELWDNYPRAWQIFGASGLAAERIWLAQNLLMDQEKEAWDDCEGDTANIQHLAKRGGASEGQARQAAHQLMVATWPQVVRLGLVLEQRKRMQYAAAARAAGRVPHAGRHHVRGGKQPA